MSQSSAQWPQPNQLETALGGLLQDIGKFMQRAHGAVSQMDPKVRARESVILPVYQGHYSHKHVLWSEAFFQWMEDQNLHFPTGINRDRVRDMAVFHHKPDAFGALGWLQAEADRLSSGMDRKPHDESLENKADQHKGWNAFIKTAMLSPFSPVQLDLPPGAPHFQPLDELIPDERLVPQSRLETGHYPQKYRELWDAFAAEFTDLCQLDHPALFCEGLLSLSERYTWAIPSSTVDLPDISLHDHNRTVAAIATCLHAWHSAHGSLADEAAIRDRSQPKFRLLAGDLSGIQRTLFKLAHQQVKGVSRILRARSFLMGMLTEAAALQCRQTLDLPVFNVLQQAGGRFVLLVPDVPEVETHLADLRTAIDGWMNERYLGELNLNLVLSAAFTGADFFPPRYQQVQDQLHQRLETVKLQPLRGQATGVHRLDYPQGICPACDSRPAAVRDRHDAELYRCRVCDAEHRIGQKLPHTRALLWTQAQGSADTQSIDLLGGLRLRLITRDEGTLPGVRRNALSGMRLYRGQDDTVAGAWGLRFVANFVPVLTEADAYRPEQLSDEAADIGLGEAKTFEHLALDALESVAGEPTGKPFLAVLKADVDHLGLIFSQGLRHPNTQQDRNTISRSAALSRMLDLFFTGFLQQQLRSAYRHTYTVYAGGDDLLLIGPWRDMIGLSTTLNQTFRAYTGANPNITLSAGLELTRANHPLNRSAQAAESRLERAKHAGRNRVCLLDEQPLLWDELPRLLETSETLNTWLRDKLVSTALVYTVLYFAEQRRKAEGEMTMDCIDWRARWAYYLARNVRDNRVLQHAGRVDEVMETFNRLLGLDQSIRVQTMPVSPRIPVSMALYRNRT